MKKNIKNNVKKKGFTLIELIAVIAILGILAAVAVPNFTSLQNSSTVKADAVTAAQIVKAARIQETDTGKTLADLAALDADYMAAPTPQSGGTFVLSGGEGTLYVVKWTPTNAGSFNTEQTVSEGVPFEIKEEVSKK